jgi:hypothetical protein
MGYIATDANLLATVIFDWIDPLRLEDLGGSWEATTAVTPWGTSAYTATIVTIGPTFMLECLFF